MGSWLAVIFRFGLARDKIIDKMASCIPRIEVFSCSDHVPLANPAGSVLNSRMLFILTCWSPSCSPVFSILEDLLLASKLPVFTRRARRKTILHPKFYFFDTGVYRAIRPLGPLDSPDEIDGAALETLFLQKVRALNDLLK